jgi:hypothetical protein
MEKTDQTFKSYRSYWHFANSVRREFRYIHSPEVREFLDIVSATSRKRQSIIPAGTILWRAQLGCDSQSVTYGEGDDSYAVDEDVAYSSARMKPLREQAREGRVNPKGIPCLYLSSDRDTALAEVRPWFGAKISVGQFRLLRDSKVIDFSRDELKKSIIFLTEPSPEERELAVWGDINTAFATPVTPDDSQSDYVPTQVISELFRSKGFDGIVFKSSCGKGYNVTLFDIDAADPLNGCVFSVNDIQFYFKPSATPYSIKKEPQG